MSDGGEDTRLLGIYEQLRRKLLDLTKRNRMLNHAMGPKNRRQVRFVGADLQGVYETMIAPGASLAVGPLPEPDTIPADERSEDFIDALTHAKASDLEYLVAIEGLSSTASDGDQALEAVERTLRDKVRDQLGLPPRGARTDVKRVDHARALGIDPSFEPKPSGARPLPGTPLQSLRFPDELDATMQKLGDDTRLAEQESGLATLFIALGFLEWYENDSSDKAYYAPLLLLPVRIHQTKTRGRTIYRLAATEPLEHNVSLIRFMEAEHDRVLPAFVQGEGAPASIDDYLATVASHLEDLDRWAVRRFALLANFSFSRIAIYEDVAPERWTVPPLENPLVRTLLTGYEGVGADHEGGNAFHAADDYRIDDPQIEQIAPILIHDADASQHSALVDVMKGRNLVIQGPPGTGKSQTIVNMIANAVAAGQTVLFVSEKQAALEAVKRRLDTAGLGDFCLELHSDKASAKAVVGALHARHLLGASTPAGSVTKSDATWSSARTEIASYLDALHAEMADGETPFKLMWRSIRGRGTHADMLAELGTVDLPQSLFTDTDVLAAARDGIDLYAMQAQRFAEVFGHIAQSPWNRTPPARYARYDRIPLMAALGAMRSAAADLAMLCERLERDGIPRDMLPVLSRADTELPDPPSAESVSAVGMLDLQELEAGLALKDAVFSAESSLAALPTLDAAVIEALPTARRLLDLTDLGAAPDDTPEEMFARDRRTVREHSSYLEKAEALRPALALLAIDEGEQAALLGTVAEATTIVAQVDPASRRWLSIDVDEDAFASCHEQWLVLREEDRALSAMLALEARRPTADALEEAAEVLSRTGASRLLSKVNGELKAAKALAASVGVTDEKQAAATLLRLFRHVRSVSAFEAQGNVASALGSSWVGLLTPLDAIERGLQWRRYLIHEIGGKPLGSRVVPVLVALQVDDVAALVKHMPAAEAYLAIQAECEAIVSGRRIAEARQVCTKAIASAQERLALDRDGALASSRLPLRRLLEVASARDDLARAADKVAASPMVHALEALAGDRAVAGSTRRAIGWLKTLSRLDLPASFSEGLRLDPSVWRKKVADTVAAASGVEAGFERASAALDGFSLQGLDRLGPTELALHIAALLEHGEELSEFAALHVARTGLSASGVGDFIRSAERALVPASQLPEVFEALLSRRRADAALRASPALSQGTGAAMDGRRTFFASRDRLRIQTDRRLVRERLLREIPPHGTQFGPKRGWTEMHLLDSEFSKEDGRFVKVRDLLHRAGGATRALKPCFMMSPLSLAKFLTPGQAPFDLLVIDEASQMRPEDALGAMLRAKRMVVVGDPKQLPPTSFFSRAADTADEEEDIDEVDDESILERCQKAFRQVRRLKWHYRSRCESLIRFSNEHFYDNGLVTFPAATPGSFSIDLVRVEGTYQSRRNVAEAERIAEEAIGLMRHLADLPQETTPTLGLVAVNLAQRDLIQETLRHLGASDERVARYMEKVEKRGEPVFVKNLENVQGDERDFILISLTYGREPGATAVMQRFGPVNSRQGHRRLNVLFSRARQRIALFTSLKSSDVVPTEASQKGVHVLKSYLEYAEGAGRARVERIGGAADSDFEVEVADRLMRRGYAVDYQVGVSGFRIDLGVRHPDHPERFLVGIECDGASYHSSKSARDRDRLREEVLRGLGWELLRVWSTDWFDDPDRQTDRLVRRLEEMRAKGVREDFTYTVGALYDKVDASSKDLAEDAVDPGDATEAAGAPIIVPVTDDASSPLDGDGPLDEASAIAALVEYRETVIRPASANFEPQRSILRDGLIETFVKVRLSNPDDWFRLVPIFQRAGTDSLERRDHLDRICAIVSRIGESDRSTTIVPKGAPPASAGPAPVAGSNTLNRAKSPDVAPNQEDYVRASFDGLALDAAAFYDEAYRDTLRRAVDRVVETEAPIYGDVLAMRIARAHKMERTGAVIRKAVSRASAGRFPTTMEEGREVLWRIGSRTDATVPFRGAAQHVRPHGDVPIVELASVAVPFLRRALSDDQIMRKMAEALSLGRMGGPARRRFATALARAKEAARLENGTMLRTREGSDYTPNG